MIRPLVKATSSRICIIPSQPARFTAGPMNLEQMSRSLRSFLFMPLSWFARLLLCLLALFLCRRLRFLAICQRSAFQETCRAAAFLALRCRFTTISTS